MNKQELYNAWKREEEIAHIHGWDFSHIEGRFTEDTDFPWDYREEIGKYLTPEMKLLDIDTGGGEFLLSLQHPPKNTAATENYPPNVQLCTKTLLPLGVDFRPADGNGALPYADESFHMVINRHGDFNPAEIYRVLKPGGVFVMQQVGAENERNLVQLLCGDVPLPFPDQYAQKAAEAFENAGVTLGVPGIFSGYPPGAAAKCPTDFGRSRLPERKHPPLFTGCPKTRPIKRKQVRDQYEDRSD